MPARLRLIALMAALTLVFAACTEELLIATSTTQPAKVTVVSVDDDNQAQELQASTVTGTVISTTGSPGASETRITPDTSGDMRTPTPDRGLVTPPTGRPIPTVPSRPTTTPDPKATADVRATVTTGLPGRGTPTPIRDIPIRTTPTPPTSIRGTATPITVSRNDDSIIHGAITAGGGEGASARSGYQLIGAMGPFAGTSSIRGASIYGGPLAAFIAAQK